MRTSRLLALCLMLGGCAVFKPAPAPAPKPLVGGWEAHRDAVARLENYTLDGRAAIQRGSEGGSLKFHWTQVGHDTDLRLMAPLGQGSFRIERTDSSVALTGKDGLRHVAGNLETLMQQHLQWSFPVEGARYWVRGMPDPSAPVDKLKLDSAGLLAELAQSGWRISALGYVRVGAVDLPNRLLLAAGEVKIRLVIDKWELPHP